MKFAYFRNNGEIGWVSDSLVDVPDIQSIEVSDDVLPWTHYICNGCSVEIPPRPSLIHKFDFLLGVWCNSISDAENIESIASEIRSKRNELLLQTDWTELPSAKERLNAGILACWIEYRGLLRNITSQPGYPAAVVWPTPPA